MLFNSIEFWLFFIPVFLGTHLLPHRGQNLILLVASYVFYGAWDWRFLSLIFASTLVDYWAARFAAPSNSQAVRKAAVAVSICVNLGILGVFKYYDFFISSFIDLFGITPDPSSHLLLNVILPVGISFYTFQTLSYTLDVHAGKMPPTRSFLDVALFVAFFPQLVAGPIERGAHFMPQITQPRKFDTSQIEPALYLIVWGLFKKVVIADTVAHPVNLIYASGDPTGPEVYVATALFAVQIYCDFSGYSDIARGVAKLLGFELMLNFNLPYFAKNPSDFWRRWHISLSSWLRDYLYISLGGNKNGTVQTYRNLLLTMTLGGLWHGARANFVLWGVYHGLILCLHRAMFRNRERTDAPDGALVGAAKILGMFQLTLVGWLLFRVETMDQLMRLLRALAFSWSSWQGAWEILDYALPYVLPLILMQAWQYWRGRTEIVITAAWPLRAVFTGCCASAVIVLNQSGGIPFIYFQF
ncbi:MAG: MBOAT family protein [Hyphomicrobiales bacterium]|nr:MBOAT family protein [Hyphomicrobiales bacterium]MCP5372012.1 MBOAT family protein [Hyphomicrobiales bacterium]